MDFLSYAAGHQFLIYLVLVPGAIFSVRPSAPGWVRGGWIVILLVMAVSTAFYSVSPMECMAYPEPSGCRGYKSFFAAIQSLPLLLYLGLCEMFRRTRHGLPFWPREGGAAYRIPAAALFCVCLIAGPVFLGVAILNLVVFPFIRD